MAYRKLRIGDKLFEYSIGSGVKIKSEGIKSFWVSSFDLLDLTKEEYMDKTRYAIDDDIFNWSTIAIGPQEIKNYLIKKGFANE